MRGDNVDLLNLWRLIARCRQAEITQWVHSANANAGEADRDNSDFSRRFQGRYDVGRTARGRNRDQNIATSAETADLTFKNAVESVIVSDRRQHGRVGGQRDRGQRIAVEIQTRQELSGNMLCIGGAATVARDQELAAETVGFSYSVRNSKDRRKNALVATGALQCFA